jgi:hypothetical protein
VILNCARRKDAYFFDKIFLTSETAWFTHL